MSSWDTGWGQDPNDAGTEQSRGWDDSQWQTPHQPPPPDRPALMRRPFVVIGVVLGVLILGCGGLFGMFVPSDDKPTLTEESASAPSSKPSRSEASSQLGSDAAGADELVTYLVTRVVDGDTVELDNGEVVRLLGIDAPEDGTCGAAKATAALTAMLEGRQVLLVRATADRDRYDRLLRYVDRASVDAGLKMIQRGLAIARYDSRDGYGPHPRERSYIEADDKAEDFTCSQTPDEPKPPRQFLGPPSNSNCEPGYSPCVPLYPPDLDCADTGPVTVTGSDPHALDGDGDGVACGND